MLPGGKRRERRSPEPMPSDRKTIGFLTTTVEDGIGRMLWSGIHEICQDQGINLVSFTGTELERPGGFFRQANMIYNMVDRGAIDGLVIWASSLSTYVGLEAIQQFCTRYRPLPMVAIGLTLEGIPSIVLDSYQGMRELTLHLVQAHGRKRLAFIPGPELHYEAQVRQQAYRDVLAEFGLADDPRLIAPPYNWTRVWGHEAMRVLVEERRVAFDAVLGVNDMLALGAMEYLWQQGVDVPGDVSITGFDNTAEGRMVTPPLTTIPLRMKERGRNAVYLLIDQMAGKAVPDEVVVKGVMRLRQSCGCPDRLVVEAGLAAPPPALVLPSDEPLSWRERITVRQSEIRAAMEQVIDLEDAPEGWAADLLATFLSGLEANDPISSFLTSLQHILNRMAPHGSELVTFQKVINVLRARVIPWVGSAPEMQARAELFLHQARILTGESAVRAQGYLDLRKGQQLSDLLHFRQVISDASDLRELADGLARELPSLGIHRCLLALYLDPQQPVKGARLLLAYDETRRRDELEGRVFKPAWRLTSLKMASDQPQSQVIHPLYYRDEQLGYLMLDSRQFQGTVHQVLCDQVSSALKSVMLVEQNSQLYRQALEGKHAAEEADLLKSRFLSMVSHELLTPMVLLVGLSEMMLREGVGNRPALPDEYIQDLTRIHAGAQQLGSLVRDVLDLARSQLGQLKLVKRTVNLEEVFKPVCLVGEQMARSKGLRWRAEVPPDLPLITGDPSRLQQVAVNLVSNAVKFTAQGEVALIVRQEGSFVNVAVRDTGLGVPPEEQDVIFDEFRQSERTVSRGYGGLGIGLAICRQLIELHGGKIGVQSSGDEHSGSTFFFTLPVLSDLPKAVVPPLAAPSQSVLVLTGLPAQANLLRDHLLHEGFKVQVVGVDENPGWLPEVLSQPPGAVVLDIPVAARGWELMDLLKSNPATQDIPVIFYSLLSDQHSGSMLVLDYLTKPLAGAQLKKALERYGLDADAGGRSYRVLLADDAPDILDMHARMIEAHIPGCRVMRASNGVEALDLMRQSAPDLVLLDLMMPELDGAGVLKAMQADDHLRDIPVIVLTAQSLTQAEMERLNYGVVSVLSKGVFNADETLAHIDKALSRSKKVGSETQRLVRKAMAFIHEHYREQITRDRLSDYVGVSDRHLNRCFLVETGLSPTAYLNRFRLQQARCLLKDSDASITTVMEQVGFSNNSYFTRLFRREVGVSPSEYQRRERKSGKGRLKE